MKNGINIKNLQHLKFYFIGIGAFFLFCIFFLFTMGKGESFLFLNQLHNKTLDLFFKNYTFLGDGLFAVILSLILFFFVKTQRLSVEILSSYIVSGLLAQVFKNIFKHPRPRAFFSPQDYAYFIDGVSIQNHVSFPSGHTTTAFALTLILANRTDNKFLQCLFLFMAILAGYSRIYLAQHFLEDVFAGAILGTIISVMCLMISSRISPKKHVVLKKWKIRND